MKELRQDPKGKLFAASDGLLPIDRASPFPISVPLSTLEGGKVDLAENFSASHPTLVLVTCKRFSTIEMFDSWRVPFQQEFPDLNVFEASSIRFLLK